MLNERRKLLVVPLGTALWTYDVRDCRRPRLVGTFDFGLPPGDTLKSLPRGHDGTHSRSSRTGARGSNRSPVMIAGLAGPVHGEPLSIRMVR